ncbi:hypothetical protein SBA5_80012 [Candidatus Sulfotelmatomonas gaucii]|uniref:Uncharacterized protein n=1 Tax=Candidatus Sulfuritelmatomonas gaucii TaxID=2043161 RepID=A0A2N9M592_9BACT|nr:hypothetical protein SBA5_80012 [Candidatus Sulfotelmatomonas gaucii]
MGQTRVHEHCAWGEGFGMKSRCYNRIGHDPEKLDAMSEAKH